MLSGDVVMINELTKFKWTKAKLNNFLTYIIKE